MLTFIVLLMLCSMYCKFRTTTVGGRIVRVIPKAVVLVILPIVMMVRFVKSAVHPIDFGSFSVWLTYMTATLASTIVMLMAVGIYVHFPTCVCEQCRRCPYLPTGQSELQPVLLVPNNTPRMKKYTNLHSTVITETAPLKVNHCNNPSNTKYSVAHSPVTTETAPHVRPPKLDHHNNPSDTMYSVAHSPVTTETTPLILHLPKVDHRNDPSHTMYSIAHSPVTTDTAPLTPLPPIVNYCNNPSHTNYSIAHSPVTTDP